MSEPVPLVSVVIASFNSASTLALAIDSVLAQTYPNLEVIVVDDGSTDTSGVVLSAYSGKVRAIRKRNGGVASTRNAGCRAATGAYIALMDGDDLCLPERIALQVSLMQTRRDIVLCGSEFNTFDARGPIASRYASRYYSTLARAGGPDGIFGEHFMLGTAALLAGCPSDCASAGIHVGNCYEAMVRGNFIHPPTVLLRRDLLESCGWFDEAISNMCDWEWLIRAARVGKLAYIERPLLDYRLSDAQLSGPRHRVRASLDILAIREKVVRDDPQLFARRARTFRSEIGLASIDAADALVDSDRVGALQMLAKAARLGVFNTIWWKVLAKSALPRAVIQYRRTHRSAP